MNVQSACALNTRYIEVFWIMSLVGTRNRKKQISFTYIQQPTHSSTKPLNPRLFLSRVLDGFGRARIYLREYCVWNSVDAVDIKELHRSGQRELKQQLAVRFLIDMQVFNLLRSLERWIKIWQFFNWHTAKFTFYKSNNWPHIGNFAKSLNASCAGRISASAGVPAEVSLNHKYI
jgi:hypothetical protein